MKKKTNKTQQPSEETPCEKLQECVITKKVTHFETLRVDASPNLSLSFDTHSSKVAVLYDKLYPHRINMMYINLKELDCVLKFLHEVKYIADKCDE